MGQIQMCQMSEGGHLCLEHAGSIILALSSVTVIHSKDVCSNGHLDIVNYLIGRDDCDLSAFSTYSMSSGDQPILHLFTM